jgi:hypothetical protein
MWSSDRSHNHLIDAYVTEQLGAFGVDVPESKSDAIRGSYENDLDSVFLRFRIVEHVWPQRHALLDMYVNLTEEPAMAFWERMYRPIIDAHLSAQTPPAEFFQLLLWGNILNVWHCTLLHFDPETQTQTFYDPLDLYGATMETGGGGGGGGCGSRLYPVGTRTWFVTIPKRQYRERKN